MQQGPAEVGGQKWIVEPPAAQPLFEAPECPGESPSVFSEIEPAASRRAVPAVARVPDGDGSSAFFMMEPLSALTPDYACLSVSGSRRSLTRQFREA